MENHSNIFKNQNHMFNWIWENRPHLSEISGKELLPKGHFKFHWQFMHVLPKSIYPKWKLNPENIMLGLPEEHEKQEEFEVFQERKQILTRIYYEVFYNKKF